jgi:hypothetical protein
VPLFLLVLAVQASVLYGIDEAIELSRQSIRLLLVIAVSSTVTGPCAGLVAPFLRVYLRSCSLGLLLAVVIGSIVFTDKPVSEVAFDPSVWIFLSIGGVLTGAVLRVVPRPKRVPLPSSANIQPYLEAQRPR